MHQPYGVQQNSEAFTAVSLGTPKEIAFYHDSLSLCHYDYYKISIQILKQI